MILEKISKEENWKIKDVRVPTSKRREPTPRHSPTSERGVPSPWQGRGAKMAPPRVRYGVALLRHGVDTVH